MDDLVERAKQTLEGVTEGPWSHDRKFVVGPRSRDDSDQSFGMIEGLADVYGDNRDADAGFVAASRQLVPDMAAEITRLRAALADAQAVGFAAGVEAAAKYIDRRVNNYLDEHGIFDRETGVTEFPGNGEEWVADQEETAEAIRAIARDTTEGEVS